jgi:hypothetical protein
LAHLLDHDFIFFFTTEAFSSLWMWLESCSLQMSLQCWTPMKNSHTEVGNSLMMPVWLSCRTDALQLYAW